LCLLPFLIVNPYVEAGYAPRMINGSVDTNSIAINLEAGQQTFSRFHLPTNWDTSHGVVAGGGVQFG